MLMGFVKSMDKCDIYRKLCCLNTNSNRLCLYTALLALADIRSALNDCPNYLNYLKRSEKMADIVERKCFGKSQGNIFKCCCV